MLIQAITIDAHRYEGARDTVDFIKRLVFPGSFIPSIRPTAPRLACDTDLHLVDHEDFGPPYAATLAPGAPSCCATSSARAPGTRRGFIRLWEFYFAYCEGGFAEGALGDAQILLAKSKTA